jgi:hypothetical protein
LPDGSNPVSRTDGSGLECSAFAPSAGVVRDSISSAPELDARSLDGGLIGLAEASSETPTAPVVVGIGGSGGASGIGGSAWSGGAADVAGMVSAGGAVGVSSAGGVAGISGST